MYSVQSCFIIVGVIFKDKLCCFSLSSTENSQISMSKSDSVAEEGISAVETIHGPDKNKKQANNRCILSERALRGREVAILTLVVVCVVGLLSLPSLVYFVEKVSGTGDVKVNG